MAAFDHWLPLHVGDYLADTMHLSTLQHGIYIRLIMHYWKRRGLPNDERALAQIAGIPTLKFRAHGGPVLALFTPAGVGSESKLLGVLDKKVDVDAEAFESTKPQGVNGVDHVTVPDIAPTLSHKRLDAELARAVGIFEHRKDAATRSAAGRRGGKLNGHKNEHLLNGESSESPTPAPQRARDSTTTTSEESPPTPQRGARRVRDLDLGKREREAKCGFVDTGRALIADRLVAEWRDPQLQVIAGGRP
jgi:uncharacterized protein YdaU (DUF1376 family)